MLGWILLIFLISSAAWFAWLFLATPASDQERIKADHAGTDAEVTKIQRVGVRRIRPGVAWAGGHAVATSGVGWFRIYQVTLARPGDFDQTYEIGVEARLFGHPQLRRFDQWG